MKMKKRNRWKIASSALLALCLSPLSALSVFADDPNSVVISEVQSNDPNGGADWIELANPTDQPLDISGIVIKDNDDTHAYTIPDRTVIPAKGFWVINDDVFGFGLGKGDSVRLYKNDVLIQSTTWTGHTNPTWGLYPDVNGKEYRNTKEATPGAANVFESTSTETEPSENPSISTNTIVINEINSSPDDWVEIMNTGTTSMDLSGWEIRDNSDDHRWKFADGTLIEAGQLLVIDAKTSGLIFDDRTNTYVSGTFEAAIGIGSGDSIRLYNGETLVDEYSWTEHASYDGDAAKASYGRFPDGTGSFTLMPETKGTLNTWFAPNVVINEVESNGDATDWVEIYNAGDTQIDISGWYLLDNDPTGHKSDITPVAEGTTLNPNEYYVFEENKDFTFGLGKEDKAFIYNKEGLIVAKYEWSAHANGVYARIPDGTGELIDFETSTKGKPNIVKNPVVINEVQSNDPNNGPDWIELANPTDSDLDISGIVIKDNNDTHAYTIPDGTVIPANGYLVLSEGPSGFSFGLGKGDSVRLYENDVLIQSTTWTEHTNPTWGLYPDVNGKEYRNTKQATPGKANVFEEDEVENIVWPGSYKVVSSDLSFLEDSSGLDFYNGKLYAVDNGTGKFWILDVAQDGTLSFAPGFENGKEVNFTTPTAKGPDTEGITVDGNGFVYLASERDNSDKGVNYNVILKANPNAEGTSQNAMQQWDLTSSLPSVSANMGIEAVEWVSNANVAGKLFDQNTNKVFDPANYPNAVADGIFFVALEDNGHVYAYVLNSDSTVVQIADIDSKLGGAMALDYDTYENKLWVAADDGYGNLCANILFNGTDKPSIVHVSPAAGVNITLNNEGFAIAGVEYTVNGQRPVYHFTDGVTSGALTIGSLSSSYNQEQTHEHVYGNWQYDQTNHWKECECSDKTEIGAHTYEWVIDKEATTTSTGLKHLECTVCKKALPAVVINKISENTTTKNTPTKTKKKSTNTGNLTHLKMWLSMLVVSGIGIVAILFKKKKMR